MNRQHRLEFTVTDARPDMIWITAPWIPSHDHTEQVSRLDITSNIIDYRTTLGRRFSAYVDLAAYIEDARALKLLDMRPMEENEG